MKMYWSTRRHRTKLLSLLCALAIFASLIPAVSAAVSPNVLENNTITDTVTPAGVQINLFDYWVTERTAVDNGIQWTEATGINKGHDLRFMANGDGGNDGIRINKYTGKNGGVRSGIVKDRLSGGYPVLTPGNKTGLNENGGLSRAQSLDYLFDQSEETETNGVKGGTLGKKTFWDVRGLLQVDDDGYYYFNADKNKAGNGKPYQSANYAYFNETGEKAGSFTVYNTYGINKFGNGDQQGQFFPFNSPSSLDIFTENNGQLVPNGGINSQHSDINHFFGVSMITRFVQRYNGKTTEDGNEAMTFEFSGDDDVWIFIDGVLVADLGGIHDQASTTINFKTGVIKVDGQADTTLKAKMGSVYTDSTYWNDNTFANDTYHTLKLFYLERGGTDSNLAMKFNLAYVPETDGIKIDQDGTLLPGVQFDLYAANRTGNGDGTYKYTKTSDEPIGSGTTDEKGRFVLTNADDIAVSLNDLKKRDIRYLILEERNENRTGYRHDDSIYLELYDYKLDTVLLNDENHRWTTGTYAALKGSVATGPDITLSDTNQTINLDNASGKLFAVIMRRLENVGKSAPSFTDDWGVVTGSGLSGWQVTGRASGGSYISAVIEALKGNAEANGNAVVFTPAANGSYMAELKKCPGDLRNYYYWSDAADTAYTVAFYYTEASNLFEANVENTHRVDGKEFDRQFAATIYIPNVQHHLYVKKVDDSAAQKPLSGAVFDLYTAESLTVTDGAYAINREAVPYDTVTTGADGLATFPSTEKKLLAAGNYYLVERTAPAGHTVNPTPVPVIVDDTHGVIADAGTDNDGISVNVAEGTLVPTMTPFATNDAIDHSLTDITTTRMEAPSSSGWDPALAKTEQTVELTLDTKKFAQDGSMSYTSHTDRDCWSTETGWLWFHITQTRFNPSEAPLKTNLSSYDLTRLFSGKTTVVVTDQRVGSLEIRKTVTDLTNKATDLPTSYALEIALNDNAYNGEVSYTSKVGNADAQTGKLQFTGGKATTYDIHPGETLALLDLPFGTTWSVKETADLPAENWRTTVNGQPGKEASGKIERAGQQDTVAIVNSYDEYNKYTGTLTGFRVSKTYATSDIYDGSVTFKLEATGAAPLPDQTEISLTKTQIEEGDFASFDNLTFTSTGTYTYTIREVQTPVTGGQMSYDDALYTITVTVTEGDRQLNASVKSFTVTRSGETTNPPTSDIPLCTFVNSYTPAPTTGTLTVTKEVKTAPNSTVPNADQTFPIQITLKNADNTAFTGTLSGLTFNEGEATWYAKNGDRLTLTLPIGTKWDVTELTDNLPNPTRWSVKVNGNAVNTANGTISEEDSTVSVVNTYSYTPAPTSVNETITVSKTYDQSADGMSIYSGEMEFTIECIEGTATPQTASAFVRGAGPADFHLAFSQPGSYTYQITERKLPAISGMTYDPAIYTVYFSVERNPTTGQLIVTRQCQKDGETYEGSSLAFENTYREPPKTGTLRLEKAIGEGVEETTFPFKVTISGLPDGPYGGVTFTRGEARVDITAGTPVDITNLPAGAHYTVTELNADNYAVSYQGAGGSIPEDDTVTCTVTNNKKSSEPKTGTLRLEKAIGEGVAETRFQFEVTIPTLADGTYGGVTFTDGKATVDITAGTPVEIPGLPAGAQYTVTELNADNYSVSYQDETGSIPENGVATCTVTNAKKGSSGEEDPKMASLTICKTVGDGIDMRLSFDFAVDLLQPDGTTGRFVISVPANGVRMTPQFPVGTIYTVTELTTGYTVTSTGSQGVITENGAEARFHNSIGNFNPIPGGDDGGTPALNRRDHYAYIIGYPDGNVRPQGNITRAEVATIFFRLLRDPVRTQYWSQTNSYSDVAGDKWYNNAISTLSNMGIICGYPDGTFRPDAPITRAELTKIAASFFADPRVAREYDGRFSDVKGSEWYIAYLMKAIEEALIYGYPDGTFGPNRPITRAETCAIVNRTLGRKPDKDHLLPELVMITWPDNLRPLAWYYAHMQEATNSHDYSWLWQNGEQMENWTGKLRERDWAALERTWSHAHSAPGGEVMQ